MIITKTQFRMSFFGGRTEIKLDSKLLRQTDEKIIVGDVTKLKKDIGWHQKIPMNQTTEDMLYYWRVAL
ncbi:GDP-mannose 4,6-dehydratase [Neobacillus muris]|uniref:GDP-mannose 4,6-dehydratase n=1 Tax=Neobacillus muris TaxID=2941334 RepID=UPI002041A0C3|nr:GDP-mannose 4,6-dehydratase [Neobacillus muris]